MQEVHFQLQSGLIVICIKVQAENLCCVASTSPASRWSGTRVPLPRGSLLAHDIHETTSIMNCEVNIRIKIKASPRICLDCLDLPKPLSLSSFQQMWFSNKEYDEGGKSIFHSKWFLATYNILIYKLLKPHFMSFKLKNDLLVHTVLFR